MSFHLCIFTLARYRMKTFNHYGHIGQTNQCYTLTNGKVLQSVLFTDNTESTIRYFLKYYYDDLPISREMFELYKQTFGIK